jgi:hypothetical protein
MATSAHPPVGGGSLPLAKMLRTQLETSDEWTSSCVIETWQALPAESTRTCTFMRPAIDELRWSARS